MVVVVGVDDAASSRPFSREKRDDDDDVANDDERVDVVVSMWITVFSLCVCGVTLFCSRFIFVVVTLL